MTDTPITTAVILDVDRKYDALKTILGVDLGDVTAATEWVVTTSGWLQLTLTSDDLRDAVAGMTAELMDAGWTCEPAGPSQASGVAASWFQMVRECLDEFYRSPDLPAGIPSYTARALIARQGVALDWYNDGAVSIIAACLAWQHKIHGLHVG